MQIQIPNRVSKTEWYGMVWYDMVMVCVLCVRVITAEMKMSQS